VIWALIDTYQNTLTVSGGLMPRMSCDGSGNPLPAVLIALLSGFGNGCYQEQHVSGYSAGKLLL